MKLNTARHIVSKANRFGYDNKEVGIARELVEHPSGRPTSKEKGDPNYDRDDRGGHSIGVRKGNRLVVKARTEAAAKSEKRSIKRQKNANRIASRQKPRRPRPKHLRA